MIKVFKISLLLISVMLLSCGSPNEPETITSDGGYKIISKFATPGYAQDVIVNDTLLYIAQGEGGLSIINVADRKNPALISARTTDLQGYAFKIERKNSVIFIATGNFGASIVDVTDPYNPVNLYNNLPTKPGRNFHVMGDFLFTAVGQSGFNIAEIGSEPRDPDFRATNSTPGYCQSVVTTADTNYLLVACGEMGFAMLDISDFQLGFGTYRVCGWKDTPGYAVDITLHPTEPVAFLACGTGGLVIVNYSDTSNIKIISTYSSGGYAKEVMYENNKVYLTTETRGLQIFDVTNPSAPVRIGTVPTKYSMGLCADEKYIYVADEIEGLLVIAKP